MRISGTLRRAARRLAVVLIPPVVVAAVGAAVAAGVGYAAMEGTGYALLGVGIAMALSMATAGSESISGWEMRMEGREPQGLRGQRWVEQMWSTGVRDPRGMAHYDSSIDHLLLAGIAYVALGTTILLLL